MKRLLPLLLFALLSACVSTVALTPTSVRRSGESPPLNTLTSRSVGDVVYETFNYDQLAGVQIADPVTINVLAARGAIGAGTFLTEFKDQAATAYCTSDLALIVSGSGPYSRICLGDLDGNGSLESWKAPEGPPARLEWAKLSAPVRYTHQEKGSDAGKGFRYELLYQGISGNVVRLLYREYINDMARPAFQQDLSYTLNSPGPTEVSFRGTRLRIIEADNNGIKYEVLSGLNRQAGSG